MTSSDTQVAVRETTDPWTDFDRLFDDLRGHLFGSLGIAPIRWFPTAFSAMDGSVETPRQLRAAPTDVTDTGKAFKVVAEVPGIPKDRLEIRVRGSTVEIRGESQSANESSDGSWVHRERTYSGFYRTLELPEPVIAGEAKATVKDGLLELELPKQTPTASPDEVKVPIQ